TPFVRPLGSTAWMQPTSMTLLTNSVPRPGCCALAANGHVAVAPARSVTNSRRFTAGPPVLPTEDSTPRCQPADRHFALANIMAARSDAAQTPAWRNRSAYAWGIRHAVEEEDQKCQFAADKFFPKGGNPKTGHPASTPGPPHCQKSFQIKFPGKAPG